MTTVREPSPFSPSGFHDRLVDLIGNEEPFSWAKRMGIPSSTFSRIWHDRTIPKWEHLIRISDMSECSIDWLLRGGERAALRCAPSPLDEQLLRQCLTLLEQVLTQKNRTLPADKKAEVVITLYEMSVSEGTRPSASLTARLVRIAS